MTIKSMITTKAIAFPSSRFLSMWTLIEQHSSLRKLQENNKTWLLPFQQRVSNARSTATLWVRRIRAIQIRIWKTPKKYDPVRSRAWAFQCPTGIGSVWRSLPAMAFASKKSVRAAEQDLQRDDGQEDDHDKGDCRSIKVFPIGVDTHRQHSSLRKLQNK
jgi:hypothetical protein